MIVAIIISFILGALFGIMMLVVLTASYDHYEDIKRNEDTWKRD